MKEIVNSGLIEHILTLIAFLAAIIKIVDAYFKNKYPKSEISLEKFNDMQNRIFTLENEVENLKENMDKLDDRVSKNNDFFVEKLLTLLTKYK
jgi:hypothetical protein